MLWYRLADQMWLSKSSGQPYHTVLLDSILQCIWHWSWWGERWWMVVLWSNADHYSLCAASLTAWILDLRIHATKIIHIWTFHSGRRHRYWYNMLTQSNRYHNHIVWWHIHMMYNNHLLENWCQRNVYQIFRVTLCNMAVQYELWM